MALVLIPDFLAPTRYGAAVNDLTLRAAATLSFCAPHAMASPEGARQIETVGAVARAAGATWSA
eukprot:2700760-Pleurochrysis_carterae.AAC.1